MILLNKLVNRNCTGQTSQAFLCLCCSQMPKTGFHAWGPFNVNLCLYKRRQKLCVHCRQAIRVAKNKIFNWSSQLYLHLSHGTSNNGRTVFTLSIDRWLPFHCQRWRPNKCDFATRVFVGLDI